MAATEGTLGRVRRPIESFVEGRSAAPAVFGASLVVYALVSLALPLGAGRDLARYVLAYAQLLDAHVVFPYALATRAPGTPVVAGLLLEAGPFVSEAGLAILYGLSITAWFCVARRFGPFAALATAVALLAYPGYVLLFHELASDALFAAAFALVALLLSRVAERPTVLRAGVLGLGVALLVFVRPVAQVLLLLGLVPLVAARGTRPRLVAAGGFAVGALVPLLALATHNALRADDFTVARGGRASLVFRAFVADRIVEPGNGPASAELARVVERELLPHEPYRSRGIDVEAFFSSGSSRMNDDLIGLADRTWGWDDDYGHLGRVGREAVRAHPSAYARGVARDVWRLLLWPLYGPVETEPADVDTSQPAGSAPPAQTAAAAAPPSSEGEPIPSSREAPYLSTPDGRIREVWTSPTDHSIVFRDPADRTRSAALDAQVAALLDGLPERRQRPGLVEVVNDLSRLYPRPFMWLLVGVVAALWRRPRGIAVPAVLAGAALLVLLTTSLVVYAVAQYAVPVVPAFVLLAAAGVVGRRSA